jgi:hypothetical protein
MIVKPELAMIGELRKGAQAAALPAGNHAGVRSLVSSLPAEFAPH